MDRADNSGLGISLHPSYGWFPIQHLGIGAQLDAYAGHYAARSTDQTYRTWSLGGSIFVRDYVPIKPGRGMYLVGTVDYGWERGKTHYKNGEPVGDVVKGPYPNKGQYASAANTLGVRAAMELSLRRWVGRFLPRS